MENKPEEKPKEEKASEETLSQRIQNMSMSEKIKLAMRGDKEVRSILIRESDRMIQLAVINSPRITENEVLAIANSRSIHDEVLRRICDNRQWIKAYQLRLALVQNPKTPLPVALKLVKTLMPQDLKHLAKSKTIPNAVAQAARRLIIQKD